MKSMENISRLKSLTELEGSIQSSAKIAKIESYRSTIQPNVTHVVVTDTDGVTGLGETFYGASSVEAHLHDVIVPTLMAENPNATPAEVAPFVHGYVGYSGSGAEVRARSALDIALWDIAAKRAGLPLRKLLRSDASSNMPTYNTCSGNKYVNAESRQSSSNWGFSGNQRPKGEHEDLWAFLNEPGRLARELLDAGYRGMKVWPFDLAAEAARGGVDADLSFGLSVLDAIRSEVGMEMDLYLELHSLWQPEAATKLSKELERFGLAWIEDPIRADHTEELAALRNISSMPVACGENLGSGINGYMQMIKKQAVDVMILDLGWCGGITDALPLMKQSHDANITTAFHDCTGPVSLAVATQVSLASENTKVQEVARAFWHSWYGQMASGYPQLVGGDVETSDAPGHGAELLSEFTQASTTTVRKSSLR
jgi:L-alanine-DL-glutamate epimerase-like enolase superfamily enzyme